MQNQVSNYYVISHNSEGKCNLIYSNIKNLNKQIIIECCSRLVTTLIIKKIYNELLNIGHTIELIHNPLDKNILDGIIDKTLNIGVLSKSIIDGDYDNIQNISLKCCYVSETDKINEMKEEIKNYYNKAYSCFKEAKKIHEDW